MLTIAADPKHLGARIAITSVLHTWGSAMTHHPHERPTRHAQIPIVPAAQTCPRLAGFLPWRLSDTGPGACGIVAMGRHPKPFT